MVFERVARHASALTLYTWWAARPRVARRRVSGGREVAPEQTVETVEVACLFDLTFRAARVVLVRRERDVLEKLADRFGDAVRIVLRLRFFRIVDVAERHRRKHRC